MKIRNKGFTLAELLIVVAIIAVLVAIAIPVFTSQLEKSREATDLANVRAAYAEVMAAVIADDKTSPLYDNSYGYNMDVELVQKDDVWRMDPDNTKLVVGGVSITDRNHWLNKPYEYCKVYYKDDQVFLNWNSSAGKISCVNFTNENGQTMGQIIRGLMNDSTSGYTVNGNNGVVLSSSAGTNNQAILQEALLKNGIEFADDIKGYQGWITQNGNNNSIIFYDKTMEEVVANLKSGTGGDDGKGGSYAVKYDLTSDKYYWAYTVPGANSTSGDGQSEWAKTVNTITPTTTLSPGPYDSFEDAVKEIRKEFPNAFSDN